MIKPCKKLQDEKYNLFCNYNQNNEDMKQLKKDYSLSSDITGLIGIEQDGELVELWSTEDNRPWNLTTDYNKVI